ncbi:MAG: SDR family NAD(P)-dependent oxidoreductase, partial [Pseudomonadota bacterium]
MEISSETRVLITAGASGIGRAMAEAFAAEGARVWITDVDARAVGDCPADWGRTVADVTDEAAIAALFDEIETAWGGLDVLGANAGTAGPTALVEDVALDDWRRCLSVNLDGAFLPSKYAAPIMKRQQAGVVLITTSTAGLNGYPHRSPYAAAKWGMIGFMKTLAMELGPHGIRVNALAPGAVEGDRMEGVMAREAAARGLTRDELYRAYSS